MGDVELIAALLDILGHEFGDPALPRTALSHGSIADTPGVSRVDNERLEFLGDAVLGFHITCLLFQAFPEKSEGDLTKYRAMIVCQATLAQKARSLDLGPLLLLGPGEDKTGGREKDSLLAGAMEALVGAVYLDGGADAAGRMVETLFAGELTAIGNGMFPVQDFKSRLQECCHQDSLGEPGYATVREEGPPHDRLFDVVVRVGGREIAIGRGKTKKTAQQDAARAALSILEAE